MKKGKFLKWMLLISIINIEVFTVVILLLVLIIGYEPMTLVQCFFFVLGDGNRAFNAENLNRR